MTVDQRRDLVSPISRERMIAATDDHELGTGKSRSEMTADCHWTDRIGTAPEQQHRNLDLAEAVREIGTVVSEPGGLRGFLASPLVAPLGGAEPFHIETA